MEVLDIPGLLSMLEPHDLNPIERLLVGHTGTNQLHLALWFGDNVDVVLGQQTQDEEMISREVDLVLHETRTIVCHATSKIPLAQNRREVLDDVLSGRLGIGQIAAKYRIPTERTLRKVQLNNKWITRTYQMKGTGLLYIITESFPRLLFQDPPASLRLGRWSAEDEPSIVLDMVPSGD